MDHQLQTGDRKTRTYEIFWQLDAGQLAKIGAFDRFGAQTEARWGDLGNEKGTCEITFWFTNYASESPALVVLLSANNRQLTRLKVQATRPFFGGQRWWFQCPACSRRVRIIYSHGLQDFRCRPCFGLAYQTQLLHEHQRAYRKCWLIRRQLGGSASLDETFPEKPPGMHWQKYRRLEEKDSATEEIFLAHEGRCFDRKLGRWLRRCAHTLGEEFTDRMRSAASERGSHRS
jgi:hypothetical protein